LNAKFQIPNSSISDKKSTSVELGTFSFAAGVYEAGPHVENDPRVQ